MNAVKTANLEHSQTFEIILPKMKKQIIIIHGGTTFDSYEDYIFYLKNKEINLEKLKTRKDWKDGLANELGDDYEILNPRMPNSTNARYEEWKIWFEKITPFLNNEIILVGHSLGGIFLAKYLSENIMPKKIKAFFLVAAPFDDEDGEESLSDFELPNSLEKCSRQVEKIYILHSEDDPVVPFKQTSKYKIALSGSEIVAFADRQHFNQETFPELARLIKSTY